MLRFKRNKHKSNFHYVAMPMMTSQNLNSVDLRKTQKSREQNIFSSNKKKSLNTYRGLLYGKKKVL